MIRRIDTKPTYTEIVIHDKTVYLSGQVPWKTAGTHIRYQCIEVFKNIDEKLEEAGTEKRKILNLQVFLKDPTHYSIFNEEFIKWIPDGFAPARNTICGITFPYNEWGLEIVVTAAL